jgi:hypothetical protein
MAIARLAVPRTHREVAAFFAGLDLLEPGLVRIRQWRPADELMLTTMVFDPAGRLRSSELVAALARTPSTEGLGIPS